MARRAMGMEEGGPEHIVNVGILSGPPGQIRELSEIQAELFGGGLPHSKAQAHPTLT